jgi:dolichol-phosphate mannosyltransferase
MNDTSAKVEPNPEIGPACTTAPCVPELTVVVPTFNERANIPILVERVARVLAGCNWEIIFVDDDSPDRTAAAARAIGEKDARVRCVRRIGRRGLSGACLEGMLASQARYLAVIDADLQHDEGLLLPMLGRLREGGVDIVVASRFLDGTPVAGLSTRRAQMSRWATKLVQQFLGIYLTDPMSGYFMIRRSAFEPLAPKISSQGFKILLDLLATARGSLRVVELPFVFRERQHGVSKLDSKIVLDFAGLLIGKFTGEAISPRFFLFCLVGLTGIAIHLCTLAGLLSLANLRFEKAQALATVIAIGWNFVLNNYFTYRDQRLSGWRFVGGFVRFQLVCAIGAISNVGIAAWLYDYDRTWWIAGLAGALVGAVWNFALSSVFVWRQRSA